MYIQRLLLLVILLLLLLGPQLLDLWLFGDGPWYQPFLIWLGLCLLILLVEQRYRREP